MLQYKDRHLENQLGSFLAGNWALTDLDLGAGDGRVLGEVNKDVCAILQISLFLQSCSVFERRNALFTVLVTLIERIN